MDDFARSHYSSVKCFGVQKHISPLKTILRYFGKEKQQTQSDENTQVDECEHRDSCQRSLNEDGFVLIF